MTFGKVVAVAAGRIARMSLRALGRAVGSHMASVVDAGVRRVSSGRGVTSPTLGVLPSRVRFGRNDHRVCITHAGFGVAGLTRLRIKKVRRTYS